MSLPDTAEYWWDVKRRTVYMGRDFKHNPNFKCSHFKVQTANTATTPYIGDINCFECIENIKKGHTEGLIEGNAPETYYLSNSEKTKLNKLKMFVELHGRCSCGSNWTKRKNGKGVEFLGCLRFPKCKNTKSIILR